MVQPLDRSVALCASETVGTEVPAHPRQQCLAVFWIVLEEVRRPAKVAHVMRVDAPLRVMRVLLSGAPAGLVEEHIEQKVVITHVKLRQLMVEIRTV